MRGAHHGCTRGRHDRGSASIELATLMPVVIAFTAIMIIGGRIGNARLALDAAAFDAARLASQSSTRAEANTRARQAALTSIADQHLACTNVDVRPDTRGFTVPVGQPATVTVTISCRVRFSDIAIPGMIGSTVITSTFTSPLDTYRSRT